MLATAVHVLRTVVLRRLIRLALVALPVAVVGAVGLGLMVILVLQTSGDQSSAPGAAGTCSTVTGDAPTGLHDLTSQQVSNAQTIVAVGRQLNVPAYGWVVAVATALQESGLRNLDYGDRDSLGLFQQRSAWGTATERTDPATAARLFYTGGNGGQPGLMEVAGFESMTVTRAAQTVQVSAFPDAYAKWAPLARQLVADPSVLSATCYTTAAYSGNGTVGARAVAAALGQVGTPYSWGGGGLQGPSRGFGPGALTVGFDCSSLAQYAWHEAAGVSLPRVTDAQAHALPHVPRGQPLRAGDLLFFHSPTDPPGVYHHMGIYDGQGNMIHAPRTGKTVEVVHDVMSVPYFKQQLAVVARPSASATGSRVRAADHG